MFLPRDIVFGLPLIVVGDFAVGLGTGKGSPISKI